MTSRTTTRNVKGPRPIEPSIRSAGEADEDAIQISGPTEILPWTENKPWNGTRSLSRKLTKAMNEQQQQQEFVPPIRTGSLQRIQTPPGTRRNMGDLRRSRSMTGMMTIPAPPPDQVMRSGRVPELLTRNPPSRDDAASFVSTIMTPRTAALATILRKTDDPDVLPNSVTDASSGARLNRDFIDGPPSRKPTATLRRGNTATARPPPPPASSSHDSDTDDLYVAPQDISTVRRASKGKIPRRSHTLTSTTSQEVDSHFIQIKAFFSSEGSRRKMVAVKVSRNISFKSLARKLAVKGVESGAVGGGGRVVVTGLLYLDGDGCKVLVADEEDWGACLLDLGGGRVTVRVVYSVQG
ncbi:hypothetical protein HDU67_002946 [Dinochytrium kinnereticum]|nr:hypothetical protein HDU67_002946 [Dinochytrium kinnereticum]